MYQSEKWIAHFTANLKEQRINWHQNPCITNEEKSKLIPSLKAWQLGETSDGSNLLCAATKYARSANEPGYVDAIALFIKEEQKHGENLGRYLDAIGEKRIRKNWGDSLFRYVRHINTSMEIWTLAVITVESAAQVYYQALKDATRCTLLKAICTDILTDEAYHISFQVERMKTMYEPKTPLKKQLLNGFYLFFYICTALIIWAAHKKVFIAGNNTFRSYARKMKYKYLRTLKRLSAEDREPRLVREDMMLFTLAQTLSKPYKQN